MAVGLAEGSVAPSAESSWMRCVVASLGVVLVVVVVVVAAPGQSSHVVERAGESRRALLARLHPFTRANLPGSADGPNSAQPCPTLDPSAVVRCSGPRCLCAAPLLPLLLAERLFCPRCHCLSLLRVLVKLACWSLYVTPALHTPRTPFRAVASCQLGPRSPLCCNQSHRSDHRDLLRAMPRQMGGVRGGLTLEKLASYDDVITDALVDKVSRNPAAARHRGRGALRERLG